MVTVAQLFRLSGRRDLEMRRRPRWRTRAPGARTKRSGARADLRSAYADLVAAQTRESALTTSRDRLRELAECSRSGRPPATRRATTACAPSVSHRRRREWRGACRSSARTGRAGRSSPTAMRWRSGRRARRASTSSPSDGRGLTARAGRSAASRRRCDRRSSPPRFAERAADGAWFRTGNRRGHEVIERRRRRHRQRLQRARHASRSSTARSPSGRWRSARAGQAEAQRRGVSRAVLRADRGAARGGPRTS